MAKMQYYGTGRRKSSVARVRLIPGKANIIINKKTLDEYFGGLELLKNEVRRPLQLVGAEEIKHMLEDNGLKLSCILLL